jgi:phosphatidylglycerophosphatase A
LNAVATPPTLRFCVAHPAHFIALGFGAGLSPWAPGTLGTLVAIPIAKVLWLANSDAVYLVAMALAVAGGIWAAERTSRDLGVADHGGIVIDEIAAFLAVLFFVGDDAARIGYAFLLFRLFDIAKPPPIRAIDARVKGGFGVMADDLVAGGFALVAYALTVRILGWPA